MRHFRRLFAKLRNLFLRGRADHDLDREVSAHLTLLADDFERRGMSPEEALAYHHVFDEPDSDHVVLTWPRTIPLREGDRGWQDMEMIERRLPELSTKPALLLWAPADEVFPIEFAHRLKELIPHAEGPIEFDRARHFLQDDRGPDLAASIIEFLNRL